MKLTLIQGDCLKVLPTLRKGSIDLLIADPPYNISHSGKISRRRNSKVVRKAKDINFDFGDWDWWNRDTYLRFMKKWMFLSLPILKNNCNFLTFIAKQDVSYILDFLVDVGFKYRDILCWIKTNPVPHLRKVNFAFGIETIIWVSRGKNTFNYKLGHHLNYHVSPIVMGKERTGHTTQKPESLIRWLISYLSKEGDTVLDPFLGSGTTMKVAKDLNRNCIGIEIEPKHIEIIKKRLNWGCEFSDVEFEFKVVK